MEDESGQILQTILSSTRSDPETTVRVSGLLTLEQKYPHPHADAATARERMIFDTVHRCALEDPEEWIRLRARAMVGPDPIPDPPGMTFKFLGLAADRRDVVGLGLLVAGAAGLWWVTRRAAA